MPYQSVDALQNALARSVFERTHAPKKAAGRALGTLVELITFYMLRDWNLEQDLAIERGLPEYGNASISHNVEFTLHHSKHVATKDVPVDGRALTPRVICTSLGDLRPRHASIATGRALLRNGVVRHACNIADSAEHVWNAYLAGPNNYVVSQLDRRPYAMFECKRVGVEDGQKKGPQTIEKAKQGAYVARSVSGLQRVARRDGSVAAIVEDAAGKLVTYDDYYGFLRDAIAAGNSDALKNVVLTVGVVSNHGNWFTATDQNKEMKVLAQSYDWLLFLTDSALAEFIETALLGDSSRFGAVRRAFAASHSGQARTTTFTKVTIDLQADYELTQYFAEVRPWDRWLNVIAPFQPLSNLKTDLHKLSTLKGVTP